MKVNFTKVNSASIAVDNSTNVEREYVIVGRASITGTDKGNALNSIDSGVVTTIGTEPQQVATFSMYGDANLNVQFSTKTGKGRILDALDEFVADVTDSIGSIHIVVED